ncbi:MAG: TetR/AcrR family transcriptional regulator [Phenylobacterium sp.]
MSGTEQGRRSTRSERTRRALMGVAVDLIATGGVSAATPAAVASGTGVARTALLYHFPDRPGFLQALANHLAGEMAALFDASGQLPQGVDASDHAIDTYWALLQEPVFKAFVELRATARGDAEVAAAISGLLADFDSGRLGGRFGAVSQAGEDPRSQTSRDLGRFLLEGLALGGLTYDSDDRRQRLIGVVKRAVRGLNRKGATQDLWPG